MVSRWWRVGVGAVVLLITTNGPVFHLTHRVLGRRVAWEEPIVWTVFFVLAVGGGVAVAVDRSVGTAQSRSFAALVPTAVVGFAGLGVASAAWSIAPGVTLGRSVLYVGLAGWGWWLARLGFHELRAAIVAMLVVALGLSLVAVLVSDVVGVDGNGDWRGVYLNRNALGPLAGLGAVAGMSLLAEPASRRRVGGGGLALLSGVVLVGTGSRTAWAAVATAVVVTVVVGAGGRLRCRYGRRGVAAALGMATVTLGSAYFAVMQVWDESTLVQRRRIWSFSWERILERPWLGRGWFTVWRVPEFVGDDPDATLGNAHNSALDVLLGVGIGGLVLFTVVVVAAVARAGWSVWLRPTVPTATILAIAVFLVVENLTESFVLMFSYNWVLVMALALRRDDAPLGPVVEGRLPPSAPATS